MRESFVDCLSHVVPSGDDGAKTLADGFLMHGYEVMRASRDASKLGDWAKKAGAKASTGTFAEAAAFPKADTAFPKTRNAERQAAETDVAVFRADV